MLPFYLQETCEYSVQGMRAAELTIVLFSEEAFGWSFERPVSLKIMVQRAWGNIAKFTTNLENRTRGLFHKVLRVAHLLGRHDAGTPAFPTASPGGLDPLTDALPDNVPLHFCERRLDLHERATGGCRGVHGRIQGPEANPLFLKLIDQRDQFRGLPAQTVEVQHNENISLAQVIEAGGKLGATWTGSRCAILEYPLAPGFLQRVKLPVEHLPALERGDAGVPYLAH